AELKTCRPRAGCSDGRSHRETQCLTRLQTIAPAADCGARYLPKRRTAPAQARPRAAAFEPDSWRHRERSVRAACREECPAHRQERAAAGLRRSQVVGHLAAVIDYAPWIIERELEGKFACGI